MSDDRAPRWLVRWLVTGLLLAVIVGEGLFLNAELEYINSTDARFQAISCGMVTMLANAAIDRDHQLAMLRAQLIVCDPRNR